MFSKLFSKLIARLMLGVMTLSTVLAPMGAYAGRDQLTIPYQDWHRFEVGNTGKSVLVPRDEAKVIGTPLTVYNYNHDPELLKGGEMITYGMEDLLKPNSPTNIIKILA
jgi:hypothetical protein